MCPVLKFADIEFGHTGLETGNLFSTNPTLERLKTERAGELPSVEYSVILLGVRWLGAGQRWVFELERRQPRRTLVLRG